LLKSGKIKKYSGDVGTRPRDARGKTARDRIALQIVGDDGNCGRRRVRRPHGSRADSFDQIDLAGDEIRRHRRELRRVPAGDRFPRPPLFAPPTP